MFETFVHLLNECPSDSVYIHYHSHIDDWLLSFPLISFPLDLPIYDLWFDSHNWSDSIETLMDFLNDNYLDCYWDGWFTVYRFNDFYIITEFSDDE